MSEKQEKGEEVAVVIDDNGRPQAQFGGFGATQDAKSFLKDAQNGGVKHLRGATVVSGERAKEALRKGQL